MILCGCSCHSECPTASIDACPARQWAEMCTCPGVTQEYRSRMVAGSVDLDEAWPRAESYVKNRKEALESVRRSANGKSRDEIRVLIETEFRARRLEVPDATILDRLVESVINPGGIVTAIARVSRSLIDAGIGLVRIHAIFRGAHVNEGGEHDGDAGRSA